MHLIHSVCRNIFFTICQEFLTGNFMWNLVCLWGTYSLCVTSGTHLKSQFPKAVKPVGRLGLFLSDAFFEVVVDVVAGGNSALSGSWNVQCPRDYGFVGMYSTNEFNDLQKIKCCELQEPGNLTIT